jgi:thiosulfate dehydrogenase
MRNCLFFLMTAFIFTSFNCVLAGPIKYFQPPNEKDIPNDEFGRVVREGRNVFSDTQNYAKPFVGNSLNCVNCHLNDGRLANSSPLWAAYVLYPSYRQKTKKVDTMANRIQGCFMYSMNGKAPAADSDIMKNLVTYMYWMSKGAPTGIILPGRGYPELKKTARAPSWDAGLKVYEKNCILCHGIEGAGQFVDGKTIFPPLWGEKSYNWGARMHRINTAAGFIKANMPLARGGMLTDQDAWDVAYFINSHERPRDPRNKGDQKEGIEETRKALHDENCSYGKEVNGHVLGQGN